MVVMQIFRYVWQPALSSQFLYLLYLSYLEVYNLYKEDGKDTILLETLDYVRNHILKGTEYYDRTNANVQIVVNMKPDANKNKEHFADALLMHVTRKIRNGKFEIRKKGTSGITKCWTMSCEYLHNHIKDLKQDGYICTHCKYKMKNKCTVEKLKYFDKSSLNSINEKSILEFIGKF